MVTQIYVAPTYVRPPSSLTPPLYAGADGLFRPAQARIEGRSMALSSPQVLAPRAVRYAWQPFPDANMVNGAGLPASTFQMAVP